MEFIIYSTSGQMEKHSDWKILDKDFTIKEKQEKFIDFWGNEKTYPRYFIEINSIEQLLKLCKYEEIIIHEKGYFKEYKDAFCIELYDDYRE